VQALSSLFAHTKITFNVVTVECQAIRGARLDVRSVGDTFFDYHRLTRIEPTTPDPSVDVCGTREP
jgi:hypothetical protein